MATYNRHLVLRCDESVEKWLKQLAAESERTPSEFIRDLIFLLRMTPSGPILCRHLLDEGIHYKPFKAAYKAPEMERPVFPWDHNLPWENAEQAEEKE